MSRSFQTRPAPAEGAVGTSGGRGSGQCAKCGACSAVCPVYQVSGREAHTARGKLHLLEKLPPGQASTAYAEILSACLLCGACRAGCPGRLEIPAAIIRARQEIPRAAEPAFFTKYLQRKILAALFLGKTAGRVARFLEKPDPGSGLYWRLGLPQPKTATRSELAGKTPALVPVDGSIGYFSGCLARHLRPRIARATRTLLSRLTDSPPACPPAQGCCGQAALTAGDRRQAMVLAKANIAAFETTSAAIVVSCASCYTHLLSYPLLFDQEPEWHQRATAFAARLVEFSTFFAARLPDGRQTAPATGPRVLYHDPCHLRFDVSITEEPRRLLRLLGYRLTELDGGPRCCGQGGLFQLAHPGLSEAICTRLLEPLRLTGAEMVVTTCTGCLLQWQRALQKAGLPLPACHPAELLFPAAGSGAAPLRKNHDQV